MDNKPLPPLDIVLTHSKATPGNEAAAKRIAALVTEGGLELAEATQEVYGDPRALGRNPKLREQVRDLITAYHMPAQVDRELVRALRRKVLLKADADGDDALVLDAAKQIASDPDVGLTAHPVPPVTINLGDLREVLDRANNDDDIIDLGEEL